MKTFVGAVKFFRKFRHPEIVLRQVQMRSERRKHLHHCRELRTAHTLWCLLRLHGKHCTPERVNELDRVVPLHMHFILRLIRRSTPRRLSKREELIVANLKIKPSGLLQLCSLRAFEHTSRPDPCRRTLPASLRHHMRPEGSQNIHPPEWAAVSP